MKRGRNSAFGRFPKLLKPPVPRPPSTYTYRAPSIANTISTLSSTETSNFFGSYVLDEPEDNYHNSAGSAPPPRAHCPQGQHEKIVIAVIGTTGAGKTKFIKSLTGDQSVNIIEGHSLPYCTQYPRFRFHG